MELVIDTRERKIKSFFQNHSKSKLKKCVKVENLDIGDIIFRKEEEVILLIERKTIEDLGSSILDGRHKEQKYRIMNSKVPNHRVLFLIEGKLEDLAFGKIKKNTLLGAIQNTMFRDGLAVQRTINIEETCLFIERFLDKYLKDQNKNLTYLLSEPKDIASQNKLDYIDVKKVKKKNNLTPEVFNKLVLLQIPGVSQNIVDVIFKKYDSIKKILEAYQEIDKLANQTLKDNNKEKTQLDLVKVKKEMLADLKIKIANDKTRKIGKVISQRIYEFLVC